jgi:hypothetical protein
VHGQYQARESEVGAQRAVTWARDHVFERSAVIDRRAILESALARGMGETTYTSIRQEFERRVRTGEFREVAHNGAGPQFTTTSMIRMEREIIERVQEGGRRGYDDPMLVSPQVRIRTEDRHPELSAAQRTAVEDLFLSRERIVGLDGVAGAGKTTVLSVIREAAQADGYQVEGFAPKRSAQRRESGQAGELLLPFPVGTETSASPSSNGPTDGSPALRGRHRSGKTTQQQSSDIQEFSEPKPKQRNEKRKPVTKEKAQSHAKLQVSRSEAAEMLHAVRCDE